MANRFQSFRTKMLLLFGYSMLGAGFLTYLIYKALQRYYYNNVYADTPLAAIRLWMNRIGDVYFFLLLFIPLSVLFFYFLTKPYKTYFQEISTGIHRLSTGAFETKVTIASNDDFQQIAEDINRAGARLKEAIEKGEFAESSKNQLVMNLAHDLRTPLTSVIGYLDIVLKDDQLQQEQAKHYTTIAYAKSKRLEKLIDELFEVTKLSYGLQPVTRGPLDLSALLAQLNEELYPLFETSALEARLHVPPVLPITGDGEMLARVFENLLVNAARYGSDGQYIDIYAGLDGTSAVVKVVNYGSYIDPGHLPYLFDMFYTGDKARTQQNGSTGLGLFIAKNIVEQHGGTITAASSSIQTEFEVRLPQI
ncbi:HAMP domain-containing sensor histidine kinase [Paenibacillus protaetiae]|uniref:histidine kinase n=1 Tax=Paenibacillus protaetiae TaxID=2509456 RepID=A0A4P6F7U2_9BACL|nr:HAMP domain-containing sensor histidine kinase [Paenibacillus protaetiae]QAY66498.1 HAMP domain-containing histidine kinase [Paenibacillus protaetiae]